MKVKLPKVDKNRIDRTNYNPNPYIAVLWVLANIFLLFVLINKL